MPVSRRLTQRLMSSKPSLIKTHKHPLTNGKRKASLSRRVLLTQVPFQARCCHLAATLSNRDKTTPAAFHSSVHMEPVLSLREKSEHEEGEEREDLQHARSQLTLNVAHHNANHKLAQHIF